MIHHYSIAVNNTQDVADVLVQLFNGTAKPFGPCKNSYFVWLGDNYGTAIEVYPQGTKLIPDTANGATHFANDPNSSKYSATHAAISIDRNKEEILEIAREKGWRALELSRGSFNVIEFWIENTVMIELLTPEMAKDYLLIAKNFISE